MFIDSLRPDAYFFLCAPVLLMIRGAYTFAVGIRDNSV
jgi:hypothetical protein